MRREPVSRKADQAANFSSNGLGRQHPPNARTVFRRLERDDELRRRVIARVGRLSMLGATASTAYGVELDRLAALVALERRIVEDEA